MGWRRCAPADYSATASTTESLAGAARGFYDRSWVVYAKRLFGRAGQVYRYLGRYTHRVAIGNARLISVGDDAIVFRTRGDGTASLSPSSSCADFSTTACPAAS